MSPIVARTHGARRLVASAALALIAATAINAAAATTASALTAPPPNLTVMWHATTLTTDNNGNGRPDPFDKVTVTADFTAGPYADHIAVVTGDVFGWWPELVVPAGQTMTASRTFSVFPGQLQDAGGSGPYLGDLTVTYTSNWLVKSLVIPAPPILYTAPAPLTAESALDVAENSGPVDGTVREGDTVGYHTTFTNTTGKVMTMTSMPGYDDFGGSATLQPGQAKTFHHNPVMVTYDDMVAGSVTFPSANIDWSARFALFGVDTYTGSYTATYGSVPTEAIDMSFTSDVATAVRTSADAAVTMGSAVAGDHIDYTFQLTNTGNVVFNYVYLQRNWSGSGLTGYGSGAAALVPGASLPSGSLSTGGITSHGGIWTAYPLVQADIDRGYVDLAFLTGAAPSAAVWLNVPGVYEKTFTKRVFLKNFTTDANLTFTQGQLNDTNGDGIGQEGETISYGVRLANNADQNLVIDNAGDAKGSDIASPVGAKFIGATVAMGDVIAKNWTYTITAADVARGTIDAGVVAEYHGDVDGAANASATWADTISTGEYVAPASTLDTAATYDDTNLDGFPSIGETVHVTVTVTNTGSYALTGLTVADAAGSNVTGLLPVFPTVVAGGASAVENFDYVLTAADFARGSLTYSTEMTATGLPTTASSTSVNLTGIKFQAYAKDLDAMAAGGIEVCESNGTPTDTITLLSTILVHPGGACTYAGLPYGYRIVGFSTPLLMGTDTFSTTVPAALHVGAHRLALYAPNGTLVGWKAVTAKDPIALAGPDTGGALANTGANGDEVVGLGGDAVLLVLLGTAFMVADSRRRKHAGR